MASCYFMLKHVVLKMCSNLTQNLVVMVSFHLSTLQMKKLYRGMSSKIICKAILSTFMLWFKILIVGGRVFEV